MTAAAQAALAAWRGGAVLRPVAERENAVFEVSVGDIRAALRLHRVGYQNQAAIESELWWCAALSASGFPCPRPLPTRDGALVAEAGDRLASVVTWCPGAPLADPKETDFRRIGDLTARLHLTTDALIGSGAQHDTPTLTLPPPAAGEVAVHRGEGESTPLPLEGGGSGWGWASTDVAAMAPPGKGLPPWFERPSWDANAFLGKEPRWGRFWENPALSPLERDLLLTARDAARADLAEHPETDLGLIHSDILRENVLADGAALWLIDFDDSGFGFRISDLASVLIQHWRAPGLAGFAGALLDGYARHRDPGPDAPHRLTRAMMLRGFASCGWIVTRAAAADPRRRSHAERALALARLWRTGGTVA